MKSKSKTIIGKTISFLFLIGIFAVGSINVSAQENEKEEKQDAKLAKQAKITMEQARATALEAAPGTVEDGELEKEHGKLVYSFDIRNSKGTISEVWVDAKTGKVISNKEESKADEEKEKKDDEKKEKSKKPGSVSSMKGAAEKSADKVGHSVQSFDHAVAGIFKN